MMSDPSFVARLEDFERREMSFLGETREVYVRGEGPAVVVMHEIPGLHPGVLAFAERLIGAGLSVYLPSVIGSPGRRLGPGYQLRSMAKACVAKEFATWATRKDSPIVAWLRELARVAHEERGGPGVGAVGMCLTGGFALGMMVDERMLAPVLSQPSLPFASTPAARRDLGVSDATLARIKERAAAGCSVMGLRFSHDPLVPRARFERLKEELGEAFIEVELDSSPGNPHGIPRVAHSVLATHFVDKPGHPTHDTLLRVIAFFQEKLGVKGASE